MAITASHSSNLSSLFLDVCFSSDLEMPSGLRMRVHADKVLLQHEKEVLIQRIPPCAFARVHSKSEGAQEKTSYRTRA